MISKRSLSKRSSLCVILDRAFASDAAILRIERSALAAGADMIQLRDKRSSAKELVPLARRLREIARRNNAIFIINDRLDLALAVDSDGLHIGKGDIDISLARKMLGKEKIIGVSVKRYSEALAAKRAGADYLGVGPVFETPVKPRSRPRSISIIRAVMKVGLPVFAIGGISIRNVRDLVRSGVSRIAVIRAVMRSPDPLNATKKLKESLSWA